MDYLDSNFDFDCFQEKICRNTRPGKKPTIADKFLTVAELDARNQRRKRNKEAAKKMGFNPDRMVAKKGGLSKLNPGLRAHMKKKMKGKKK